MPTTLAPLAAFLHSISPVFGILIVPAVAGFVTNAIYPVLVKYWLLTLTPADK